MNTNVSGEIPTVHHTGTDVQVRTILESLSNSTNFTLAQHIKGIDTELAQFVKGLVSDRPNALLSFFTEQSERYCFLFFMVYAEAIRQAGLDSNVDHYALQIDGLNLTLWVILKNEDATFDECAAYYNSYTGIKNNQMFRRLRVDLSVFSADEAPTPSSFQIVTPAQCLPATNT